MQHQRQLSNTTGYIGSYSSLTRDTNHVPISIRDILSSEQERKIILQEGAPGSWNSTTARYIPLQEICSREDATRIQTAHHVLPA